ncbi:Cytochrome c oxidase polypeptide 5 [Beauveria bassiana D1-5]|uniref:Cytochrome c oxidase polypeptide 5 n=1 Tax=Beauveria bassiana D1-5 TaxID=1245745 RepID=A0A0A2VC89_BEABA|nr:Cytochrome c oxidase polypeptide 5 [Beauveria bassiana D1-5]
MLRTQATNVLRRAAPRAYSTQALSNPTLKNIEKRWEGMPLQEQADLWMALRDRMKGSWSELTLQEKKAGALYSFSVLFLLHGFANNDDDRDEQFASQYFAFSSEAPTGLPLVPMDPRATDPPGTNARIAWGVALGVGASVAIFAAIRLAAKPAPYTMTKEYQEESNEFLLNQTANPITGISSEGYTGKGVVQSPPKGN